MSHGGDEKGRRRLDFASLPRIIAARRHAAAYQYVYAGGDHVVRFLRGECDVGERVIADLSGEGRGGGGGRGFER